VNLDEALGSIAGILDGAEVAYMITGSLAAAYYVAPRSTRDIDVVIEITSPKLRAILESLRSLGWYVDAAAAEEARRTHGLFNAIDPASGWKVDFIVRKDRPYSVAELARRQRGTLLGADVWLATLEDVIISKLEWAALGDSERQREDVALLLARKGTALDRSYVEQWVRALGLEQEWRRASTARPTGP
jgi:hypothetical protein